MYCYSSNSRDKIIHMTSCRYCRNIKTKFYFDNLDFAKGRGYRFCRYCSPIAKYYWKEETEIANFSFNNGISCAMVSDYILVNTPYSRWKIIVAGKKKQMFLYHRNSHDIKPKHDKTGIDYNLAPGYHSQRFRSDTIIGYLNYIVEHDGYRLNNPVHVHREKRPPKKGTKRYRKEQNKIKRREQHQAQKRVLDLIESLEAAERTAIRA